MFYNIGHRWCIEQCIIGKDAFTLAAISAQWES